MANTDLAVRIATILDASGLKKADKELSAFQKNVKSLGKTIGISLSAAAVADFAKRSVSAFMADEAAASKLSLAVKNLGMEFANPYITQYIADMEKMTKVADDELRPAFQTLLQQTGSLGISQSALSTAIEVSRGSGESLSTVVNDLAQAYVGNTKGLKKYYLGLSSAALQAKSFTDIQKIMNDQFSGSSAAYLSTYSGQVGVLSLAWGNFQEKVGGTLITLASFGDGAEGTRLNLLAATLDKIGSAIELIGKGKEALAGLFNVMGPNGVLSGFNPYRTPTPTKNDKAADPTKTYAAELAKIERDRKKQADAIVKSQKALTAEQKKQAALKKAGTIFDLEQINLVAALKGNLSEEERKRVLLQLALLTDNVSEAQRLTKEIALANGLGIKLANDLSSLKPAANPFEAWSAYLDMIASKVKGITSGVVAPGAGIPATSGTDFGGNTIGAPVPNFTPPSAGTYGTGTVVVQIDGKTIASALMDQSLSSGNQAYINRRTGGFE